MERADCSPSGTYVRQGSGHRSSCPPRRSLRSMHELKLRWPVWTRARRPPGRQPRLAPRRRQPVPNIATAALRSAKGLKASGLRCAFTSCACDPASSAPLHPGGCSPPTSPDNPRARWAPKGATTTIPRSPRGLGAAESHRPPSAAGLRCTASGAGEADRGHVCRVVG